MTEYLARISARRPLLTILLWVLVAFVGGGLSARLLDSATTTELRLNSSAESEQTASRLDERLRGPRPIVETVIVRSDSLTVDDEAFQASVASLYEEISALGDDVVAEIHSYLDGNPLLVSADRRTTILPMVMTGDLAQAEKNVEDVLHIVEEADAAGEVDVYIVGNASISVENAELAQHDLEQGERVGVPVAMLILVALFGAIVAALLPIGLSVICILAALGLAALIGQVFQLVFFVTLFITMIGLAVGIDYSLIIVSRFRDEMARGLDKFAATERAGATAGRTVLFSGTTVVIALCGMFLVPFLFFQSLAIGAILVVVVAMLATLTLLPAVLALMGPRINLLSVPFFGRTGERKERGPEHGFWEIVTEKVMRYPILSVLGVGVPMVIATYFYFDIRTGINGVDALPEGAQTRDAFFVLEESFSFGLVNPTEIVVDGDVSSPQVKDAMNALAFALLGDSAYQVLPPDPLGNPLVVWTPNDAGDLALLTVILHGEPSSQSAVDAVNRLRDVHIPAAFDGTPAEVFVGGTTAVTADVFDITDRYTPIVFAFVLGFSFLVLMLVFRSIVIPIKAVAMNLLSVGTAYGLLVLVFQKGLGTELLGFQHAEVIDVWIPLFLFSILFGLSMDYHVFLLSRIRERYDQTGNNAEAVAYGLRSTAGLITGAALIMVAVFGAFASGDTIINQQVGFGLSVAVFLDATLVRSVLVPATMEMLGARNWYLPPFLRWLPDLRVEPAEED
ncbi:MAG: MMPL family transporter [Chloroflexota bacterium]|nr:MMPL family transporter [Chloroflexota bacterium]MDE2941380.1 MMPL family transporter [Chloroflexota bacterium]MDE3267479.1 MMPL family transporter [Chloroflexota bacterium]